MVTTLAHPATTSVQDEVVDKQCELPLRAPSVSRDTCCPRCSAHLRTGYFEPECLQCGYVDYSHQPAGSSNKSLLSSGTRYVLRYVGEFQTLVHIVTHIKLRRIRNRVVYRVNCPFCGNDMDQTSLSGKRREVREERYKCIEGHRVSLSPSMNGGLGWK